MFYYLGVTLVKAGGSIRMLVIVHQVEEVGVLSVQGGEGPSSQGQLVSHRQVGDRPVLGKAGLDREQGVRPARDSSSATDRFEIVQS
jgi:hypothetical protein